MVENYREKIISDIRNIRAFPPCGSILRTPIFGNRWTHILVASNSPHRRSYTNRSFSSFETKDSNAPFIRVDHLEKLLPSKPAIFYRYRKWRLGLGSVRRNVWWVQGNCNRGPFSERMPSSWRFWHFLSIMWNYFLISLNYRIQIKFDTVRIADFIYLASIQKGFIFRIPAKIFFCKVFVLDYWNWVNHRIKFRNFIHT